ncbi:MAG TPA: translation initiation factor 2 [Papillibacter sp.]|nr:translation initiation factor 2 [Papillibacter sp.]
MEVVKGTTRRVIVIKSPDKHIFDEAIFLVNDAVSRDGGVTSEDIIRQAQEVAENYVRCHIRKKRLPDLPAPVFAVLGAALTGLVWFISHYFA